MSATVGAFGFAATISAATAPSAHADDFTDVINNIDANLNSSLGPNQISQPP